VKTNYVLIDYENVQVKSLALLTGEAFQVRVFLGPHNTRLPVDLVIAMQALGERAEYIVLEKHGTNALDFHIAYYLGVLSTTDPGAFFHIISKDTGFDPLIKHVRAKKVHASRSRSIEEMPCFAAPAGDGGASAVAAPATKSAPTITAPDSRQHELVRIAVDDLIKRKSARPRTTRTLLRTIHAACGKEVPAADIQAVLAALVEHGQVRIDGGKVTYDLPGAMSPPAPPAPAPHP
jgi:hypothetical protein